MLWCVFCFQTSGRYDNKVDIFALGVILVESFLNFGTASERARVLPEVRRLNLPDEFKNDHPQEVSL